MAKLTDIPNEFPRLEIEEYVERYDEQQGMNDLHAQKQHYNDSALKP